MCKSTNYLLYSHKKKYFFIILFTLHSSLFTFLVSLHHEMVNGKLLNGK